jgi:hypothetical protein
LEGRYWQRNVEPDEPSGNAYLWTRRQAIRPNKAFQDVRNLVPGLLYSAELITADYQDIKSGRSRQVPHAVSLAIEGADAIRPLSYHSVPVKSTYSHPQLPFINGPAWFNHHRLMFRARHPAARLWVSDWASDKAAGGPEGQELMFNYVQVQPYFEITDSR